MTQFQNLFTRETVPWVQQGLLGERLRLPRYGKLAMETQILFPFMLYVIRVIDRGEPRRATHLFIFSMNFLL